MVVKDLFFRTSANGFDVDKMQVSPLVKRRWRGKCKEGAKPSYERYIRMLQDLVGFKEGIRILDVGCGVGAEAIELSHLGAKCVGIDGDMHRILLLNQVANDFSLDVNGIYSDACNLPFDNETFDTVMSLEFFEHVTDLDAAMKEQIRVLRRGGRLVIEQGNLATPAAVFGLFILYFLKTRGRHGGLRWLFTKGKVIKDPYGSNCAQRDEDIHSRRWWRQKISQYSELDLVEFTSSLARLGAKCYRIQEPIRGNIIIVAIKR